MKITFIIGGARSGKSSFALKEASKITGQKAYIATAQAFDDEMKERIEKHKRERGDEWNTFEEPLKIAGLIPELAGKYKVVLLDCLTLWLSNIMCSDLNGDKEINDFISALKNSKFKIQNSKLHIVSNEVGMGLVPENELARKFRDLAGMLNRKAAEIADEVYLVIAGIPVKIKG